MAESGAIRAGRAFVELFADDSRLAKGLKAAEGKLKAFGGSIASIGAKLAAAGASVVAPLTAAAVASAEGGARLYDMARRTGMSVEALSRLGFAADMTGADLDTVEGAIRRMQKTVAGVADTMEGTTGELGHLGLTAAELKNLAPEKQFERIAAAIAAISDPTEQAAATMKVFGKAGTMILPLIQDFAALNAQADKLGFVKSAQSAADAKAYSESLNLVAKATKAIGGAIFGAIGPALAEKTQRIFSLTIAARDWMKANAELVASIFNIAAGVAIAGAALIGLGMAFKFIGAAVGTVWSILSGVKLLFVGLAAAGGVVASIFGAILSPAGLVIAAIAGVVAAVAAFTGAFAAAGNWLKTTFGGMLTEARATFGAIASAISAGDVSLAVEILGTQLQIAWLNATQGIANGWSALKLGWNRFLDSFMDGWIVATAGIQKAWAAVVRGMERAWFLAQKIAHPVEFDFQGEDFKSDVKYRDRLREIDAQRNQKLARNAGEKLDDEASYRQEIGQRQERIGALQSKLDWEREYAEIEKAFSELALPTGADKMDGLKKRLGEAGEAAAGLSAGKTSVQGTFNAMGIAFMGGSTPMNRIAAASERTAENTRAMRQNMGMNWS